MRCDLHVHTWHSDESYSGPLPVEEVICTLPGGGNSGGYCKLTRDVFGVGWSTVLENPCVLALTFLGIAVPLPVLANYVLASVFSLWRMYRFVRMRTLGVSASALRPKGVAA